MIFRVNVEATVIEHRKSRLTLEVEAVSYSEAKKLVINVYDYGKAVIQIREKTR